MKRNILFGLMLLIFGPSFGQESWTNIGRAEVVQSPNHYIYYELFDLNNYSGHVWAELEILVTTDPNYHYMSRYSIMISRWSGTAPGRLDGVTMNYISGKPGLLEILVFDNKLWIRAVRRWGTLQYRQVYGFGYGNWTIPLTASTTRPSGYVASSTQPFYYSFDTGHKLDFPSLLTDGKVGIGTSTPDAPLTVKGQIHAQEVKVDLMGAAAPDFVFEESYNLESLEDLEEYIQQHKHLPGIPSGLEMEANGIKLKEMNLKLLRKVEELTLHLIAQNKANKEIRKELLSQKKLLSQLKDLKAEGLNKTDRAE